MGRVSLKNTIKRYIKGMQPINVNVNNVVLSPNELLKGKSAIVTGAGSGIGKAIAKAMVASGAQVVAIGRTIEKLNDAKKEIGDNYIPYAYDVSDVNGLGKTISEIKELFDNKQIDILVNSAGVKNGNDERFFEFTPDEFDYVVDTNLKATFFWCQQIATYMIANNIQGHIVNVISIKGIIGEASPYSVSKWGCTSLTNFRFCKIDICDREAIYKLFEEEHPDMVVNFAAESHVDRSIENPEIFLDTNIKGTAVMMDACRKYGIKRYHQVSTDEVYGDLPLDRPDLFFTEETPIHTSSPYSSSKAGADLLVLAYHRTYGLPVTISRCSNNYGPYHFPEKLIPLMIANALADKPLPVYGEGLNVRDWLYVEDHCRAIDLIIHNGRVGEVYNVGGHNEMKNIDIVKIICKELGKPESLITHVTDRKGHDMRYAIDPTKIHNELGWLPETKFEDGIKKTIQWYLDNKEWWETIISGEYQNYYEKMYGNR